MSKSVNMPAVPDEPSAPVFTRELGSPTHPWSSARAALLGIGPRQVFLKDRNTAATLIPFCSDSTVPKSLLQHICREFNKEVEKGDTYPLSVQISPDEFRPFWFSNFGAIMLLGNVPCIEAVHNMEELGTDWSRICIGSFNIQPNFPGRSSHICSGTFLVNEPFRNRGAGRLMGEVYLEWASQLGFTYTVFNVVYETNTPSCRLWDTLGFKRIGKIPGCGSLRSYPGQYVDGIIFGRKLNADSEDLVSEERFDKIRYYLKYSKYPSGSDRAEKSRLRSAATHYKLIGGENGEPEKLMLKDKEVISDPQRQLEISRDIHLQQHAGINKTTATIALKYHWVRIKETVSTVIKNCPHCKEIPKSASSAESFTSREDNINPKSQQPQPTQTFTPGYMGYAVEKGSSPTDIQMANSAGVASISPSHTHARGDLYDALASSNESFGQPNGYTTQHNMVNNNYNKSNLAISNPSHVMQQVVNGGQLGMPLDPQISDIRTRLHLQEHSSTSCAYGIPAFTSPTDQQPYLNMSMNLQSPPEHVFAMGNTGGRISNHMASTNPNYGMGSNSRVKVCTYPSTQPGMYTTGYIQSDSSADQYVL